MSIPLHPTITLWDKQYNLDFTTRGSTDIQYTSLYPSPLGPITMASDGEALTGAWFEGQQYFGENLSSEHKEQMLPIFKETTYWFDIYFQGRDPGFFPAIHLSGSPFRLAVWEILKSIPFGKTITYQAIAKEIARKRGIQKIAAQAVGGAVGHNPVSVIIPCHRVIGSDWNLTGYSGGIPRKIQLLKLEGIPIPTATKSSSI